MDPEERRSLILTAARQAFASQPYDKVSMTAIAAQAQASEALVHKYYTSKASLYAEVLAAAATELSQRTRAADAALPAGSSNRDRVRIWLMTYLDFIAERTAGWEAYQLLADHGPSEASAVRHHMRRETVAALANVIGGQQGAREQAAFWGYTGFVDTACLRWIEAGCPEDQRHSLIDAALGCLEGALGDWRG